MDPTWKNVHVITRYREEDVSFDPQLVSSCLFMDDVFICSSAGYVHYGSDLTLPCIIHNTTLRNTFILPNVHLSQNTLIENTIIQPHSIVMGCGRITCQKQSTFGNGVECNMGNETGGLVVPLIADLLYNDMKDIVDMKPQPDHSGYIKGITSDYSIIGDGALVETCSLLESVVIGPFAHVESSHIINSSLMSSSINPTTVFSGNIQNSILQWGTVFESGSNCSESLLCEHTSTSCNAKIVNSIIAPNTGVSSGECNSSLVGPFIGFHHNSVLISAIWLYGKGNIGYGANIGSNHTGRLPDQECFPGEGVFFGLGCNIKYPCNLLKAPYSLIASGITLLPQKVEMPFSLINKPSVNNSGVSPAYNEILPGWALYNNYYMIIRNENKFRQRNKSKRNLFETDVIRQDIVDLMVRARSMLSKRELASNDSFLDLDAFGTLRDSRSSSFNMLRAIGEESEESESDSPMLIEVKDLYTDSDISGIGKNMMTERSRQHGITIYSYFIRLFYLRKLKALLHTVYEEATTYSIMDLLRTQEWKSMKEVLSAECKETTLDGLMATLFTMEDLLLRNAIRSKKKDFVRGRKIYEFYDNTHSYEKDLKVVEERRQILEEEKNATVTILNHLKTANSTITVL